MQQLRDPEHGCPWDKEQTFATVAPYTLEEAYEVVDAIEQGDMVALQSELGDLLLQVMFHARMAEEGGHFTIHDVARGIVEKMITRHPHVFGDADYPDEASHRRFWETQKAQERADAGRVSALDDIPLALPSLVRAQKLQKRAARVGFDWADRADVLAKVKEELMEVTEAMEENNPAHLKEEIGDLLFTIVNLARASGISADEAMCKANRKFDTRFRHMESHATAEGTTLDQESLAQLEQRWQAAKQSGQQD